jgi:hypothetical protein
MTATWLIFYVDFFPLSSKDILLQFVKPMIQRFEDRIETYHHFFEPQLLVRVRADESVITKDIVPFLELKKAELKYRITSLKLDPNYDERRDFGDGWPLALRLFEMSSRAAILKLESAPERLGPKFEQTYFSHLLFNEIGLTWREECLLHYEEALGRLALDVTGGNLEQSRMILSRNREKLIENISEIEGLFKRTLSNPS